MRFGLLSITLLAASAWGQVAAADTIFLTSGGRIEGELLNPDQTPREAYELRTSCGGTLTLARGQVERVVVKSQLERQYEEHLPKMADTAEAHWDMAERCGRAGLNDAREFHLKQVLRHDPDHTAARHGLGYTRIDGRWIRQDEWMAEQGYVRHRGTWRLPQEIALREADAEREAAIIKWRKQLRIWRDWLVKGRDNSQQGEHELRGVRDPFAVTALTDMLENEKEHRELKLLYIEVLGRIGDGAAVATLTKHALYNDDGKLREACLEQLQDLKSPLTVQACVRALQHEKNHIVQRAGVALGRLRDPNATLPLINALITEHKQIVGGGGGISPTFSNQGSGLSMGGKPKVKKVNRQNEPVLHALSATHQGVNFGYDIAGWKKWYISSHTPPPVDLRRER